MPDVIKKGLDIRPVKWIDEVLEIALEKAPIPLKKSKSGKGKTSKSQDDKKADNQSVTRH